MNSVSTIIKKQDSTSTLYPLVPRSTPFVLLSFARIESHHHMWPDLASVVSSHIVAWYLN
jgi:hypothetical protein